MTQDSRSTVVKKRFKRRLVRLKWQLWTLFLAWKDPHTPMMARIIIAVAVAYAVSPIDLIPDFIPVLGQLDDLLLLPLLVALAMRLIPQKVLAKNRRLAWHRYTSGKRIKTKAGSIAAAAIVFVWIALTAALLLGLRSCLTQSA
ncbi:MAG: DUF1232 domain-containing protein [Spirochaetes bacterium]|nr:DUF1232 domain-containing protein [Spirochaetota bacterium]MBU0955001.1 DUF1232 domain-containing protein [Spirochaetota bacterium]